MTLCLRFKGSFVVKKTGPETVFLFSEKESHLLSGSIYGLLAPLLEQGQFSEDELASQLAQEASSLEVYYALARLEQKGFIEKAHAIPQSRAAFFHELAVPALEAEERLRQTRVSLHGFGGVHLEPLKEALRSLGVQVAQTSTSLTIVATRDYLDPALREWNQTAQAPWLLVKPVGIELWIGPFFEPNSSPCWECLASRLNLNRIEERYVHNQGGGGFPFATSIAELHATTQIGAQLAALEIVKAIAQPQKKGMKGRVVSLDFATLQTQNHVVVHHPQCPHCGIAPASSLKPLVLHPLISTQDNLRTVSVETILEKYGHHMSPISGIVQNLQPAHGHSEPDGIHVFHGGHNFALSNEWAGVLKKSPRALSGGKGRSSLQAKAGCLCEAIERYSGLWQGNEGVHRASYRELQDLAIHPREILHFSALQYAKRQETNPHAIRFHQVFVPFDEEASIDWTPVWSLSRQTHRYVPTAYCYYGTPDSQMFCGDSNGNAAGFTIEEAILQGFFELVERDSVAIWWYNRLAKPSVDLASFNDPFFTTLIESYRRMSRKVWVLDLTTDLKIPAFAALSCRADTDDQILLGFGAHLNPRIAVERALTEMNQSLHLQNIDGDDKEARGVKEWFTVRSSDHAYFQPGDPLAPLQHQNPTNLLEAIQRCQRIVEDAGMEMLVLDQTRSDVGLPVVKVIVPGLRHFWPRFAPGRLYDVPVQMGWLKKPLTEAELNPVGMFL